MQEKDKRATVLMTTQGAIMPRAWQTFSSLIPTSLQVVGTISPSFVCHMGTIIKLLLG